MGYTLTRVPFQIRLLLHEARLDFNPGSDLNKNWALPLSSFYSTVEIWFSSQPANSNLINYFTLRMLSLVTELSIMGGQTKHSCNSRYTTLHCR